MKRSPPLIQYDPGSAATAVGPHLGMAPAPEFLAEPVQVQESSLFSRMRRRKFWFVTTTLLTGVTIAAIYCATERTYQAQGSVMIAATAGDSIVAPQSPQALEKTGDAADMESQLLLLRSPQLLHEIISEHPEISEALMEECQINHESTFAKLKAYIKPVKPCSETLKDQDAEVSALSAGFDVAAAGRSRVITVGYTSPEPRIAKLMVNTLIDAYVAAGTSDKLQTRTTAANWITSEVARLEKELAQGEHAIEDYRRAHGLIKGQTSSIQAEGLSSASQQLAVAMANRAQAEAALKQVGKGASTMKDVTGSPTITALRAQQATVAARVAQMGTQYGARNPEYVAAKNELANINSQIAGETGRLKVGLQQAYDAANQQVHEIQAEMAKLKSEVGTASDAESAMGNMMRDVEVKRELYTDLSKKKAQLETERRLVSGDARIVSHADKPTIPYFPKLMPFAAGGTILAFAIGIAAAVLRDRADKTVRATIGLEWATHVQVLGHIPAVGRYKQRSVRENSRALVTTHPQLGRPSALQEAIRSLYAQCILMNGPELKTVMITSSIAGEGKTFLTLAIAQFAAQSGKKVLAIEGDMRRPTFADRLQVKGKVGLVDVLRGQANIEDAIQQTRIPGLHLITAGRTAHESTELLSNGRMEVILKEAAPQYDLIFIDSPPSQILVDARLLAPMVDGILYCAKWGSTQNDTVAVGVRALKAAGGTIIGMVLGQVKSGEYKMYETRRGHQLAPYMLERGRS